MDETKVIYHIDDEETPYLVKIPICPEKVTLSDFKNVLNRPNYKFFFKSMDDDFGVVKEEIIEDSAHLPCFNGRVVSWLVSADGSNPSESGSQCTDSISAVSTSVTSTPHQPHPTHQPHQPHQTHQTPDTQRNTRHRYGRVNGQLSRVYESSIHTSHTSDCETSSWLSERSEACSSSVSELQVGGSKRRLRRRRQRPQQHLTRTSSYSSVTDSTMSLNIITVALNMDTVNFLGISIVGQSNKGGDGGIYVGSIMKGGAVALDGRIEPGDMILQVNDVNFENMTNDEAVRVLREVVQKPGPIKLVVAKCWDPNPKGYFTIPRAEPVRPIDPSAWIAHTQAICNNSQQLSHLPRTSSSTTISSGTNSIVANNTTGTTVAPITGGPITGLTLTTAHSDMLQVVHQMARADSGLEIRDRMWLKITIPNAFIGADIVDWLLGHVDGFQERRDARKYASQLLRAGLIRHTVNKLTFSEQCYYVFHETLAQNNAALLSSVTNTATPHLTQQFEAMNIRDGESIDECAGGLSYMPYSGTYNPLEYQPMPFYSASERTVYGYNRDDSVLSGSSGSLPEKHSSGSDRSVSTLHNQPHPVGIQASQESTQGSSHSHSQGGSCCSPDSTERDRDTGSSGQSQSQSQPQSQPPPPPPQSQPPHLAGSNHSLHMAMRHPCEMFVDVM